MFKVGFSFCFDASVLILGQAFFLPPLVASLTMASTIRNIQKYCQDFTALFFPNICMACMYEAPAPNKYLCVRCQVSLPKTDFHLQLENAFTDRLWGRLDLHTATAMFLMIKNGLAENIVYNIKYKDATYLATSLGEQYGRTLKKAPLYADIDVVVPVPIHHSKMRTRGYNQSALFGQGIATSLDIPCHENALLKKRKTKSQTKKSRMERLTGVEGEYAVQEAEVLKGKNVLLVDDVMTTGATIESCALEILKVEGTRVSLATIGMKDF